MLIKSSHRYNTTWTSLQYSYEYEYREPQYQYVSFLRFATRLQEAHLYSVNLY